MQTISIENRALRYGDGLFETICVFDKKAQLLDLHYQRLSKGLKLLAMDRVRPLSFNAFECIINDEINRQSDANLRIRIAFFRKAGGLYTPTVFDYEYTIESSSLQHHSYQWNPKGARLGICPLVQLSCDALSELKTSSALPYVLAGVWKRDQGLDDCVLLNSHGRVAESLAANIFILKGNTFHTPVRGEGAVEGVMKRYLLQRMQRLSIPVEERKVELEDLLSADEIILTNAIHACRWVASINGRALTSVKSRLFFEQLFKK